MTTLVIVAVHDRQLNAFMRPFIAQTPGQALRSFRDEINRPGSDLNSHPEDYALFKIGEFEEATGHLTGNKPEQLAIATNLIEKAKS